MPLPPNIILIGFMGSGKTETGKIVSKILGFRFWDMDQWIEKKNDEKIPDIFQKRGELFFRRQENKAVLWLSDKKKYVASTGGGAWLPEVNRKKLLQTGCCVWLKVSPEEIWRRVGKHLQQRPLLSKSKNPRQAIKTLVEERNPYYSLAHACIETTGKPPQQVALEIVKVFKKYRPFDLPKL